MANQLSDKDKQWRKRPNGASPVFDAGLSALGTDDEAGGAAAPPSDGAETANIEPLTATPDVGSQGLRLPYPVWFMLAGFIALALITAGIFSLN